MKKENTQIISLEKEVSPIVANATRLTIKTDKDLAQASETLSKLNKFGDALKEDREKITAPLNEALREVRAKYKPLETVLTTSIALIRGKMTAFHTEQTRRAEEALSSGNFEDAVDTVPVSKLQTASGNVTFKKVQQLKITNLTKIPREYLIPDEDMITSALKEGKVVAGCELEEVSTLVNRRK